MFDLDKIVYSCYYNLTLTIKGKNKMILDSIEFLKEKDSNFNAFFNDAAKVGKVDIMDKLENGKSVKNKYCTIRYNKAIQGVEIKVEGYDICVCNVDESELRDVAKFEEDLKFAYVKCIKDGKSVDYDYSITYNGRVFILRPTIKKAGSTWVSSVGDMILEEEDLQALTGVKSISL